MPLIPRPPTKRTPHNKSTNARDAEERGERVWTGWTLRLLIEQVLLHNADHVTEKQIRSVRNLEYLKVMLLKRTEKHHTGLRMPDPIRSTQVQYFAVDPRKSARLKPALLNEWKNRAPGSDELDEMVENLTGRTYYRK